MDAMKEFIAVTLFYNKFNEMEIKELFRETDTYRALTGGSYNCYMCLINMSRNGEIELYTKEYEDGTKKHMVMLL